MKNDNLIAVKTFEFSLTMIHLFMELKRENKYIISKQVLRSSTSIGAYVEEAIAAQSKRDFISKVYRFKRSKRNEILAKIIRQIRAN